MKKEHELISAVIAFNEAKPARLEGLTYKMGVNGYTFNLTVLTFPKMHKIEKITVPLCNYQDYTGNRDLDSHYHLGFTIGRGKVMYFMMIWHRSGTCTVYPVEEGKNWPRNLTGNENITIHFKL